MEPLEYLKILQRRWTVIASAALIAMAAAWATVPGEAPQRRWTATHTLYQVVTPEQQANNGGVAPGTVSFGAMANLASAGQIPQRVVAALNDGTEPAVLMEEVTVAADADTNVLTVTANARDGARAQVVADTFAVELIRYFDERAAAQRKASIDGLSARLELQRQQLRELPSPSTARPGTAEATLLQTQLETLLNQHRADLTEYQRLQALGPATAGVATLEAATAMPVTDGGFQPPTNPVGRVGLAGLVGLVLGMALALALERVDTRVRTRRGAENAFRLPIVTEIPRLPLTQRSRAAITTVTHPASVAAESFRLLRLALQLMPRYILEPPSNGDGSSHGDGRAQRRTVEGPAKVILVTSASAGEGKTSTLVNLAASFAEGGKRVYCVDCDLRHPRLHTFLGGDPGPGVTDFLDSGHDQPVSVLAGLARPTTVPGVRLIPRGSPTDSPGNLLAAGAGLLNAAAELADIVLVDAGPLLQVGDPAALAPLVDAVVVVARSGKTTAEEAHRTSELLARLQAPVLGIALVGLPRTSIGRGYYTTPQGRPTEFLRGLQRLVREGRER